MFEYQVPTKVVFGQGYINQIGEIIKQYGDKVLLVIDPGTMQECNMLGKIKPLIQDEVHGVLVFDKIDADSNSLAVDKGAEQARYSRSNVIVGFGRKTTLNIAKAIAFTVSYGGSLEDHFFSPKTAKYAKKVSYIEIPTSPGFIPGLTDTFWIVDNFDKTKKSISGPNNFADLVLVDPKISTTLPENILATIVIEILSMSIEAYISKAATPISDALVIKAIESIAVNLTKSIHDMENMNFRNNLCSAAVLGSMGVANSSVGTSYALSLAMNSFYQITQGFINTILLPHVMEFNLTAAPNRYVAIARAFGEDTADITVIEAAIKAVENVREIILKTGVDFQLNKLNVSDDHYYDVAQLARQYDFMHHLPRPVSKNDLYHLLMNAT